MSLTRQAYKILISTSKMIRPGLQICCRTQRFQLSLRTGIPIRSSSILSRLRSSSATLKIGETSKLCGGRKTCTCGIHKMSEGDKELAHFLDEELAYEKESLGTLPKIKGFKVDMQGTEVTLTKKHNSERITVTFDINQNINVDKAETADPDDVPEDGVQSEIVSYPTFSVKIVKDSGRTLQIQCSFGSEFHDGDEDEAEDTFKLDSVTMLKSEDSLDGIYDSETENMDPNLYQLLTNFLYERGIDYEFGRGVLDFSTVLEHDHYVNFLEDLKSFVSNK